MLRAAAQLLRHAVGYVYPNTCLLCDTVSTDPLMLRHGLCSDCRDAVVTDAFPTCPRCAQTVGPHSDTSDGCGECRAAGFAFDAAVRLGPYTGRLREAVLRIKSVSGEGLADLLGRTFLEVRAWSLAHLGAEVVVPVPLHPWRKWMRGYNQSEALAREIAAGLRIPCEPAALRRVRLTTQHAQPTRAARLENMKNVFGSRRCARVAGKSVLLVDDVLTTGTTASAAARALRDAGAVRVAVAVLARR